MIIPIRGAALPESAALLTEAIQAGFGALGVKPCAVQIDAPAWPEVGSLQVDVSGAKVDEPQSFPHVAGAAEGTLAVAQLALLGKPVSVRGVPLSVELRAEAAQLRMTALSDGGHALVLQSAADGSLAATVQRGDLERMAHALLAERARQNGADLVQTRLQFTSRGPRALSIQAEVTAKMMMMKVPLAVSGDLDLDEQLNLSISNLQIDGSGMIAGMARSFLQPHFDKLQQRPIALAAFTLGALRLRDARLAVDGETLRLEAKFGS